MPRRRLHALAEGKDQDQAQDPGAHADPRVRGARLKKGARLEVRVSHASYVTRIFRFTVKSYDDVPVRTELCQAPGAKRPGRC